MALPKKTEREKIAGIQNRKFENADWTVQVLALSAQLVTAYQTYLTNLELISI
jgi:hypothetical protein